jgi:hypothetical protein
MSEPTKMALFNTFGFRGLELRDYFAAKAMQSLIAHTTWGNLRDVPRSAYIVADQMLKEREIENDPTKK